MAGLQVLWIVIAVCGATATSSSQDHSLLKHDINLAAPTAASSEPEVPQADRPSHETVDLNTPTYSTAFQGRYLHIFQALNVTGDGWNSTYYIFPSNILVPSSIEYDINNGSNFNTISLQIEQWNAGLLHHVQGYVYRKTGNSAVEVRIVPFKWMRVYAGLHPSLSYRVVNSWVPVQHSPDVITARLMCGSPFQCEYIAGCMKSNPEKFAGQLFSAFKFRAPVERKVVANVGSDDLLRSPTFSRIHGQFPKLDFIFVNDKTMHELARDVLLSCIDFIREANEFVNEEEAERLSAQITTMIRHNVTSVENLSPDMLTTVHREHTDPNEQGVSPRHQLSCLWLTELRTREILGDLVIRLHNSTSDYTAVAKVPKNDTESSPESIEISAIEISVNKTVKEMTLLSAKVNMLNISNNILVQDVVSFNKTATLQDHTLKNMTLAVGEWAKEKELLSQRIDSISSAMSSESTKSTSRFEKNEQKIDNTLRMLGEGIGDIRRQLNDHISLARDVDEESTIIAQRIAAIVGEPRYHEMFVEALLETTSRHFKGNFNVMVFNIKNPCDRALENVVFFRSVKYKSDAYYVWVFEKGTFRNKGSYGWSNWGFTGQYTRIGQDFVNFQKIA